MTNAASSVAVSFILFIVIWNQRLRQTTPAIHFRMAEWLEEAWVSGDKNLLLMAFRAAGKSTMVGLFAAWLLYRQPDLRILVVAADTALAGKMVRNVRRILECHPLTAHLRPDNPDQWAGERFTVRRNLELRDPSMMAKGITANVTGCRADVIVFDDVEVPNTSDTAAKRADLRERLGELSFVLMNGGTQLYVGTPHTYYTIYADVPRTEVGEEKPFLIGFSRLKLPILEDEQTPAWPERYSIGDIQQLRVQTGPNKFASQMMLRPVNIAEGRLDPKLLKIYEGDLAYDKILRRLYINDAPMIGASAWWDPAFGSAKGDHSVLAVVFAGEQGDLYIHRVEYIEIDKNSSEDNATAQCKIVAQVAKDLVLPSLCVEINGIGKFLPAILRNEMVHINAQCRVVEVSSRQAKDLRILEAFDALLAAEKLHLHQSVLETPFITEIQEWRPGGNKGHDDGLDAVAGALSQQPVRINRLFSSGRGQSWMKGRGAHDADTGFDV